MAVVTFHAFQSNVRVPEFSMVRLLCLGNDAEQFHLYEFILRKGNPLPLDLKRHNLPLWFEGFGKFGKHCFPVWD